MTAKTLTRVAIYLRISKDDEGTALGVARQREDCLKFAERMGWTVIDIFEENDVSASAKGRKPRPKYEAMIAGVIAGKYDVIVAYSMSRLTRRMLEMERLIELHEKTSVLIHTVASGSDDLSTADGRMVARIKASVDAAEAERTGERARRMQKQRRDAGLPHNASPRFGYRYTKATGYQIHEAEAEALRDAYRRVITGETLRSIAIEWNARGIKTTRGNEWSQQTLRAMLTTGFAAGWIRERSKPSTATRNTKRMDTYDTWRRGPQPTIINDTTWEAFKAKMKANESMGKQWVWARAALSGLLVCGACGPDKELKLVASNSDGMQRWICPRVRDIKAHRYITIANRTAEATVLAWLDEIIEAGSDVQARAELIDRARVAVDDIKALDAEAAKIKAKRLRLASDALDGVINPEDATALRIALDDQLADIATRKGAAELERAQADASPLPMFTTLRETWPSLDSQSQREALARLVKHFIVWPNEAPRLPVKVQPVPRWTE